MRRSRHRVLIRKRNVGAGPFPLRLDVNIFSRTLARSRALVNVSRPGDGPGAAGAGALGRGFPAHAGVGPGAKIRPAQAFAHTGLSRHFQVWKQTAEANRRRPARAPMDYFLVVFFFVFVIVLPAFFFGDRLAVFAAVAFLAVFFLVAI